MESKYYTVKEQEPWNQTATGFNSGPQMTSLSIASFFVKKKNSVYLDIFLRLKWEHIGKMASKLYTYQCFVNISPFPLKCLFPFQL